MARGSTGAAIRGQALGDDTHQEVAVQDVIDVEDFPFTAWFALRAAVAAEAYARRTG